MVRKGFTPDLAKSAGLAVDRFPENMKESEIAEAVLSKELEKLSLVEHEKIIFDLHGIAHVDEEDPEFIQRKLEELDKEIGLIETKPAYKEAERYNKKYVHDRSFRLMFLRSEEFVAKHAAELMVRHFEVKQKNFGEGEVLARGIHVGDLTEGAIEILESGLFQVAGARDAAGRLIVCIRPSCIVGDPQYLDDLCKATWYFYMAALRDDETQKKGIISIIYNFTGKMEDANFTSRFFEVKDSTPTRLVGAHYCFNSHLLRPYLAGLRLFMGECERFRIKEHFGEPHQVEFELQTFGIPTKECPMRKDGSWSLTWHLEWLRIQRARDDNEDYYMDTTIVPRRFDVLYGKNRSCREHTGNLRLLHLCTMHWVEYESARKFEKTAIAERLLAIVYESKGRFLKWEENGWVEVGKDAAREKISHFFRQMRCRGSVAARQTEAKSTAKRVSPASSPEPVSV